MPSGNRIAEGQSMAMQSRDGRTGGLICYAASALIALMPNFAVCQEAQKIPRIGLLMWSACAESGWTWETEFEPLIRGLRELGYEPGKTIAYECRGAGQRDSGLAEAVAELVQLPVDMIVSNSQPAGRAARLVTETVPIVTIISGDPVAGGLAQSLAKPGGNLTGVSYYATELTAKRLEIMKEALPGIGIVGVLANPVVSYLPFEADTKRAAAELGIALRIHQVTEPADLKTAFSQMAAEHVEAVFVLPDMMLSWESPRIADLALEHHLPTMAWGDWYTKAGCLMAYSTDYVALNHRLAYYVDRILKGAKPGDLPIEQPTTFKLSINLKTAKALGIEVPSTLLLQADQIIE
jgi:putative ABC transport system substrate-binding protein